MAAVFPRVTRMPAERSVAGPQAPFDARILPRTDAEHGLQK